MQPLFPTFPTDLAMRLSLLLISIAISVPAAVVADEVIDTDANEVAATEVDLDDVIAEEGHLDGDHDAEHAAGHEGGHGDAGPLEAKVDLGIYSLIVFLAFLGLLWKLCWEPLMSGLNQREANIRGAVDAATSARDEAAALLAEHKARMAGADDEVKEIIAEARRDAETTKADILAKANEEATAARDRSLADIERAKQQALVELAGRERDLVIDATEQVLGRTIDENDRQRLIDEALGQFASRN